MTPGRQEHDRLRAELPEGSTCISNCPYCAEDARSREKASKEEKVSDGNKVYDQETVDALLESARSKAAEEARAEAEDELTEAQATIAKKDEELEAANKQNEELQAEIDKRDEEARLAELAEERKSKVAEVTDLTEEQLDEHKAAWAKMSEEDFDVRLAELKAVTESAKASSEEKGKEKTPKSKFDSTRETAGKEGTDTERMRSFLMGSGV
jgi:hypothetical protein